MKKKLIITACTILALAIVSGVGLVLYVHHSLAGWSQFEFAVGQEATAKIRNAGIPVPNGGSDPMYWYECGIDHTAYMSYSVPKGSVAEHVAEVMRAWGTAEETRSGNLSEFRWINAGPKKKPSGWQDQYWALPSVADGVMYEERYRFVCGDRGTGRVYACTWSE